MTKTSHVFLVMLVTAFCVYPAVSFSAPGEYRLDCELSYESSRSPRFLEWFLGKKKTVSYLTLDRRHDGFLRVIWRYVLGTKIATGEPAWQKVEMFELEQYGHRGSDGRTTFYLKVAKPPNESGGGWEPSPYKLVLDPFSLDAELKPQGDNYGQWHFGRCVRREAQF
jgi:hypothetical protein